MPERSRRRFHELLDELQTHLIEMAGASEELVRLATEAVLTRDGDLAGEVRQGDERIDQLELEVDERALELLALQQPMARDLRQITATLKIANDLERVGDHAVKMAYATRTLAQSPPVPEIPQLREMIHITRRMLADALQAYTTRDPRLSREVRARDDRVDELRDAMHRILVSHMLEDPRRISAALELIHVAESLERVADLATNVAEETVFLVEGTVIRHEPEVAPEAAQEVAPGVARS